MDNKKHIDRLFQEKFKDFEVAPSDAVWERISENLPVKKEKKKGYSTLVANWWRCRYNCAFIDYWKFGVQYRW